MGCFAEGAEGDVAKLHVLSFRHDTHFEGEDPNHKQRYFVACYRLGWSLGNVRGIFNLVDGR